MFANDQKAQGCSALINTDKFYLEKIQEIFEWAKLRIANPYLKSILNGWNFYFCEKWFDC